MDHHPAKPEKFSTRSTLNNGQKWMISIVFSVIAAAVFSPLMYAITNKIIRGVGLPKTTKEDGSTYFGLAVHATVLALVIRLLLENSTI